MWNFLCSMFSDTSTTPDLTEMAMTTINPATGMPMLGDGIGGIDFGGSPFGMDIHASPPDWCSGFDSNSWD